MLVWLGLGWSVLNVNATGGIHVLAFTLTMSTAMSSRVVDVTMVFCPEVMFLLSTPYGTL